MVTDSEAAYGARDVPSRGPNLRQWEILRHLSVGPAPQQELAVRLGRSPQNVGERLALLKERGWIEPFDERARSAPNAPARQWRLTDDGRRLADQDASGPDDDPQDAEERPPAAAGLEDGQGFVAANLSSEQLPVLLAALGEGHAAVRTSVVARLDGEQHAYLFLFDRRLGAGPSEVLAAALSALELPYTVGTVSQVRTWGQFIADAAAAGASAVAIRDRRQPGSGDRPR